MQQDRLIRATGKHVPFRLVLVDFTRGAEEIGQKHGASSEALKLLAETSIASLILSSGLKFAGTVCVRVTFDGDITFAEADSTPMGLVRAMIPQSEIQQNKKYEPALSPQRFEVVTLNEKGKRASESIIEAVSESMGRNLSVFMYQSAQTRSAVGIEARLNAADPTKLDYAIGFYLEPFADISDEELSALEGQIAKLPTLSEFFDGNRYNLNALMGAISGDYPVTVVREIAPRPYCPCNKVRSLSTLASIPSEDLQELVQDGKNIELVCDFCRNKYIVTPDEIQDILNDRLLQ